MVYRAFPQSRLRRNRKSNTLRNLLAENSLSANDFILPIFVTENSADAVEVKSLPNVKRYTVDQLENRTKEAIALGCKSFIIFGHIPDSKKDAEGSYATSENNIVAEAIAKIKATDERAFVIADIALDPYTSHGHDGILNKKQEVDNDKTIIALSLQAKLMAKAGADAIAPSDMMDGRVAEIRKTLDDNFYSDCLIISYSAKYASFLYGPFRSAVGSRSLLIGDKKTYQLDSRNSSDAIEESRQDIQEGADALIVKPGIFYLDILKDVSQAFKVPVFSYQVSGEYSMIKSASNYGMDSDALLLESLISLKRAGARAIITYGALEAINLINKAIKNN